MAFVQSQAGGYCIWHKKCLSEVLSRDFFEDQSLQRLKLKRDEYIKAKGSVGVIKVPALIGRILDNGQSAGHR